MLKLRLILVVLVSILAAACGSTGGGGGGQVAVDTAKAPLDFTFRPPAEAMVFIVEINSEAEFRGTGVTSSLRFHWTAKDWQEEAGAWVCDVTFSDIAAAMRQGSSISMEPIDDYERLEGFSLRYKKDAEGFNPVSKPAKDQSFMAMFGQLQYGMAPLDIKSPAEPVYPGQSWQESIGAGELAEMAQVMRDSIITNAYTADEEFKGRPCAKIDYSGKLKLDGTVPGKEGAVSMKGSMEVKGQGYFDRQRGFFIRDAGRLKNIIDRRELDADGKPKGAEMTIVQSVEFTIGYQGQ